ncbi:kinesin-like protein KIF20B [Sceloporus undulatus]|uniref:kinesin-like protein KIF20B n=1 Tax=Sceloporus undulatus TaxID=8520 RepID=UPI001C4B4968|nr:kinesin-like protein KIF20B [Sceloporus undulatus]
MMDLTRPVFPRRSFISAVEVTPRTGPVDASDIKKNLYGDFSSICNTSQRESLESKEGIHVCLRIKPLTQPEKDNVSQECISVLDPTSVILKAPQSSKVFRLSEKNMGQLVQKFTFSQVFGPETTQEELFEGSVKQPVLDFIKGHSRLVFTYGVTNAGKTYTYQGTEKASGLLPRALKLLFKRIQSRLYPEVDLKPHRCREHRKLTKEEAKEEVSVKSSLLRLMKEVDYPCDIDEDHSRTADSSKDFQEPETEAVRSNMEEDRRALFSVWVSFCEIYNESIYDLLLPLSSDKRRKVLRLAQDIKGCSYVKDLQWIQVLNFKEAFKLMKLGLKHQSFASTKLNANSSRSHSIFTVKMLRIASESTQVKQVNELFLCDLAGSERCTRTHNEGNRLKESGNINNSLLILGKCINALKTTQQSKLQQHIPFRESKLTHFFQGFFSGKGKVCMIVNVSQSAAAYDETLNVLKFSSIAQKVMVLDSPNSPPKETFDQISVNAEYEGNTEEGVCLPKKRATMLWERNLEDVMEDEEELVEDSSGLHDENSIEESILVKENEYEGGEETPSQTEDESDIIIGKEEYQRLLHIIEELKNKLIDERKDKLLLELKIREEVTREFARYYNEKENTLKMFFSHREDMMEENCEKRVEIYKELVKECTQQANGEIAEKDAQDRTQGYEAEDASNLSCMVESMQQNVSDIKQQAAMAYRAIDALEEPQTTIERLEKQLAEVTAELSQIREELLCRNQAEAMKEDKLSESAKVLQDAVEKMALQNKRIQELSQVVEQKDDEIRRLQVLINEMEAVIKVSENTIIAIKHEMGHEDPNKLSCTHSGESLEKSVGIGRKRCIESQEEEDGPPAKQGSTNSSATDTIETKEPEEMRPHTLKEKGEVVALEEKNKLLEIQLVTLRAKLEKEKDENEGFSRKIASLSQELFTSEEKASDLSRELQQQRVNIEKITSELVALKDTNKNQGEQIQKLLGEIEVASQTIAEQKINTKAVEVKIGELSRLGSQGLTTSIDLASPKRVEELPKEGEKESHVNCGQRSSFHCSIESIWEVSKQIIHASSQKSSQIENLLQQVEQLQRRAQDAEDEMCKLKVEMTETTNQLHTSLQEKECLINQLKDLQEENALYAEKYREEQKKAHDYLEQLENKDELMEEDRAAKEAKITCLEQTLRDKDSAILAMEIEVKDLQERLNVSESKIRRLDDQESQLKAEVVELRKKLRTTELQEKDKEEAKQMTEQLNSKLSESIALSSNLRMEIQRKDEEYADLKEKLADAKKQIEQVQREVCSMRSEDKSLRSKVSELEKAKNQLTEELEVKQRTIQQFNQEELNKKLEDIRHQYRKACEDISHKDKIIKDMKLTLEEQEQTQSEQEEVLEARLEENERCASELEEWKKKYHELEKRNSSLRQQNGKAECEKSTTLLNEELARLQEKLKECEEQHKIDRKKWLTEKMLLISQAKEAETHRNREMKKFAENREHHTKQLIEAGFETTTEALTDDGTKELKRTCENFTNTLSSTRKGVEKNKVENISSCKQQLEVNQSDLPNCSSTEEMGQLIQNSSRGSSPENIQDQSDSILDSCEVSSENDQTSRFPKPEMEIQFTPLQPNKMEVKHQGSPSSVTIKVPKAKKRKSSALDERNKLPSCWKSKIRNKYTSGDVSQDFLKNENEKNAASPADVIISSDSLRKQNDKSATDHCVRKEYPLRSKHFASKITSPGDTGGTLQKFGSFLQSSPTIIQSKAKKFMATIKSTKPTEEVSLKEVKPKRAKRKLYSTDISSPMDFSGHVIVMDQKESDHEIIKRRLRTKKTH